MHDRLIFLDIDGVMKPGRCYFDRDRAENRGGGFDPLAIHMINRACDWCDARVVLNTVWNTRHEATVQALRDEGLDDVVVARTDYPGTPDRLRAVEHWLVQHAPHSLWAMLDDCPSTLDHHRFVRVDHENGISTENYRDVTRLLGREDKFMVVL